MALRCHATLRRQRSLLRLSSCGRKQHRSWVESEMASIADGTFKEPLELANLSPQKERVDLRYGPIYFRCFW